MADHTKRDTEDIYEGATQDDSDPRQPQLDEDNDGAINHSNVVKDRLRHAKPQTANKYSEGPDEDDLPAEAQ
ncbi:hypothetical protein PENANT_c023G10331 [Penicillium antarcticum]|uniref:Histone chaperone domain-containing protein n=1 Tax=Penicillium antarcticum TaxID=416450 RepID=A0A1V6PYF7_9EURO|nr:uncharacterized protein N7508_006114 [Penicillium antarcticum]KAJ5301251.1 hypothetical protein N7508_006114 [Penicillium antarcticum]OQD82050.1 hypothetical protein PENANT_c023G10331 [Penicillium antarcticum]